MALTYAQLEGAWVQAGGNPAKAPIAAAVAMAESGGNPLSHNGNAGTGDNSYGLWQINMLGSMGPARLKQYNLPNNEALFDPVTNARVAVAMSGNGTNWGPWTTYTRGAYLRYMQNGVAPNTSGLGGGNFGSALMGDSSSPADATLASIVDDSCVLGWSGLGGIFGSTGHFCLLTKSETRAILGGLLLASGSLIMGVGAILLVMSFGSLPSAPKAVSGILKPPGQPPASAPAPAPAPAPSTLPPGNIDVSKPVSLPSPAVPTSPSPAVPAGKPKTSLKMTAVKALKFVV